MTPDILLESSASSVLIIVVVFNRWKFSFISLKTLHREAL